MNYMLSQIILASRSDDGEGWMNILFVVVLAVFWAVAAIVKAKAKKPEPEDEEESPSQPARRPPSRGSTLREQLLKQFYGLADPTQRPPSRPEPRQPATRAAEPRSAEPDYAAELERAVPEYEAGPERTGTLTPAQPPPELTSVLPELTGALVINLGGQGARTPAELRQAEDLAEILLDYADPEELRRAIVHYEILGRPLSLRESSAHMM